MKSLVLACVLVLSSVSFGVAQEVVKVKLVEVRSQPRVTVLHQMRVNRLNRVQSRGQVVEKTVTRTVVR